MVVRLRWVPLDIHSRSVLKGKNRSFEDSMQAMVQEWEENQMSLFPQVNLIAAEDTMRG